MTANFGKLQNQTLELKDGLNILQAPNETGKSTWCSFFLSMLYGVNSRERERTGYIPDKLRYAPWCGTPMSGTLDCAIHGSDLTITRSTRRQTAPMAEFRAVYSGTGDSVPDITAANCGEQLLGVSREVFERSALIRQNALPIRQDPELERRISSLISAGEEGTSYSEAAAALKAQLNRRRHNKTGLLPPLERQLLETEQQLAQAEGLSGQLEGINQQTHALQEQESALLQELSQHEQWDAFLHDTALSTAKTAAESAAKNLQNLRQQLAKTPDKETLTRLIGAIANLKVLRKKAENDRWQKDNTVKIAQNAKTVMGQSPFAGQSVEEAQKSGTAPEIRPFAWWMPVGTGIVGVVCGVILQLGVWGVLALELLGAIPGLLLAFRRNAQDKRRREAHLSAYGVQTQQELTELMEYYIRLDQMRQDALEDAEEQTAAVEELYASLLSGEQKILRTVRSFSPDVLDLPSAISAIRTHQYLYEELAKADAAAQATQAQYEALASAPQPSVPPTPVPQPTRNRKAVLADLTHVRTSLFASRSAADRLTGQLHTLGDPLTLAESVRSLRAEIRTLEEEYQALELALSNLDRANALLQTGFSPALGKRASELFGALTEGRYHHVRSDQSFQVTAQPVGDTVSRSALVLSGGTADQLYLAVRLAICDLILPEDAPILLDDALASFDDQRCRLAVRLLQQIAERRQVLLFTCHGREATFADPSASIQQL